jgi:predicted nucleotide-binding protein (sugar kinase/HSP70/actin superfamily)
MNTGTYTTRTLTCHGCDNNCLVVKYDFGEGNVYYSGNRCERVFHNGGEKVKAGRNAYGEKLHLLFDRALVHPESASLRIGIPRVLNMFEDFPFWHTLLTTCGLDVILSEPSDMRRFERNARMVMSDNICFPAKLVHAHLDDLREQGVDRIFFPFVVHGPRGKDQNSYNCPIVAGYSQVVQDFPVPVDAPVISMKDKDLFLRQCSAYLSGLGVPPKRIRIAFDAALKEQGLYEFRVAGISRSILAEREKGNLVIMLAGRPYHSDPLIQHGVAEMIAALGADVITDDLVRDETIHLDDVDFLSQWTYTNRILRAAKWCAEQGPEVQFVELTSFGCGPDAFLTDSVRDLLHRYGKSLTLLKLDDISNVGSMKLRVRSLLDSIRISGKGWKRGFVEPYVSTPAFQKEDRKRTIIAPFFTPFISPLIPAIMHNAGYNVICLPQSDSESADNGLKYANNEVCYPATLVIGDIIRALQEGHYALDEVAVAMTQTGGQCRASNYLPMIKKAMVDAGYGDVPVISIAFTSGIKNQQPGFKVNWVKMLPVALYAVVFSDTLAKLYYPAAVRETIPGEAAKLKQLYLKEASELLEKGDHRALLPLAAEAARQFDAICDDSGHKKVGIVGEIYLKFNPFAHHNLPQWLMDRGIEVVPPILTDFFTHYFVNRKVNRERFIEKSDIPGWALDAVYRILSERIGDFNDACRPFRHFTPFEDVFKEAENAAEIISLSTQFGEGWMLPGEISTFYKHGVKNVLSLQPFGCIANHIVVRGVEKRIKQHYPDINLLCLDFDGGVSEVNILNRMLLFEDSLR